MKSSESKKGPEKTPPIEKLTITQELQKNFPDFFQTKKQSSFFASRSKSPSISLRENLTVKEKANFIKEYHDLIAEKYKEIQSPNAKEDLVAKDTKEQDLFKELKELDEKVKTLSDNNLKLNEELYNLSPDHYPQATIIGRNALQSRKKSALEIMTGKELFIFHAMIDLYVNNKKQLNCTIYDKRQLRIERDSLIKILDNQEYKEVLEKLFSNYKNATDKGVTIKFAFHLLSNPDRKKTEEIYKDINSLKIENISEKDLEDFLKLSKCYSTTEKISTLETLKKTLETLEKTLETLKQPEPQNENNNTTKMLKTVGDYLTKMKQEETQLIKTFQDEFKTKSNYEIINLLLEKIKKNDLELKIFCKALDEDNTLNFKLEDLKLFLKNLNDKDKNDSLIKLENTLKKESKINRGNLKTLQDFIRENKEGLQDFIEKNKEELLIKQPQTTTSLFLGFVPHNCSKFIPKEIKDIVKTSVRFGVRLSEEMQKPDTNIVQALHEVVSNINNKKTK